MLYLHSLKCYICAFEDFIFVQLEMFRQTAAYSFQPPDRPGFRCHHSWSPHSTLFGFELLFAIYMSTYKEKRKSRVICFTRLWWSQSFTIMMIVVMTMMVVTIVKIISIFLFLCFLGFWASHRPFASTTTSSYSWTFPTQVSLLEIFKKKVFFSEGIWEKVFLLKFFKQEHLTDVTFLCNDSKPVHAHRKVLVQISPLLRKIVNSRPKEERLMIVVDVSYHFVVLFFNCIYSNYWF